jgi:hypothetical protein
MRRPKKACQPKTGRSPQGEACHARRSGSLSKAVAILVAATFVGGLIVYLLLGQQLWDLTTGGSSSGPKTAVIVDQLSLTQPNPAFAQAATSTLEQAGYVVDYYPGEQVTVDFYRNLPTHGYDLIIMRVHSGLARDYGQPTNYVSLFSNEPFSDTKYAAEKAAGLVGRSSYYEGGAQYFGIVPAFIESSMAGRFDGATIVLMGCDGLITDTTAEAFIRKGAKTVVGWSGRVSAAHTDAATERLLVKLLVEGLPLADAVAQTAAEVGPDPDYGSTLLLYPPGG